MFCEPGGDEADRAFGRGAACGVLRFASRSAEHHAILSVKFLYGFRNGNRYDFRGRKGGFVVAFLLFAEEEFDGDDRSDRECRRRDDPFEDHQRSEDEEAVRGDDLAERSIIAAWDEPSGEAFEDRSLAASGDKTEKDDREGEGMPDGRRPSSAPFEKHGERDIEDQINECEDHLPASFPAPGIPHNSHYVVMRSAKRPPCPLHKKKKALSRPRNRKKEHAEKALLR